ncbi:MAG: hypothetical protein V3T83_14720 [Acidobacteriota bacterium]
MPKRARDPINDFVRNRIRRLRRSKNLSTRQLAALSGIPEGSYCCLEGGFYRISFYNLQKIMQALGGSIHDVWPQAKESFEESPSRPSKPPTVNYFRFREFCSLTEARGAALLSRRGSSLKLMFESDLDGAERADLLEALTQKRSPGKGWRVYEKSARGKTICLALHNAQVEGRLGVLLELYLDLWLATQIAR